MAITLIKNGFDPHRKLCYEVLVLALMHVLDILAESFPWNWSFPLSTVLPLFIIMCIHILKRDVFLFSLFSFVLAIHSTVLRSMVTVLSLSHIQLHSVITL